MRVRASIRLTVRATPQGFVFKVRVKARRGKARVSVPVKALWSVEGILVGDGDRVGWAEIASRLVLVTSKSKR